jgi:pterin-4a-carbinolamine dehydratase
VIFVGRAMSSYYDLMSLTGNNIMNNERKSLVFISYRRQDSSAASRWLSQTIQRTFGPLSAFMDTESIRMADDWPERIDEALRSATVLVAVIGPSWLRMADGAGRRRLDQEDDWVRNEIRYALENGTTVLPILLSRTPRPERSELPDCLVKLAGRQAFELRDDRWESDLNLLLSRLGTLGFEKQSDRPVRYPKPLISLKELSRDEIMEALKQLADWELTISDIPGMEPQKRTEFKRAYEFASFEDAIDFMHVASKHISEVDHHPRWENVWRTVTVWLSTWDIGHKPSRRDIELAKILEDVRRSYPPPKKKGSPIQPNLPHGQPT